MNEVFEQTSYQFRFDWGLEGLQCLAPKSDMVVIVDVLSFTTAVGVAVERGATVYPYRWEDDSAASFAESKAAILIGKRAEEGLSLSPASLAHVESGQRLVMPSPNGSMLSFVVASAVKHVIAGSLRNAKAVADIIREHGNSVAVIAAGERWPNGDLRPSLEDLIGAGAILSYFEDTEMSPEAKMAVAAFRAVEADLNATLMDCVSGRELVAQGFKNDVEIASGLNESAGVPMLIEGAYTVEKLTGA